MKQYWHNQRNSGQAMILFLTFFLFISLSVVVGIVTPVVKAYGVATDTIESRRSYYMAESGIEDVLYRVKNAMTVSGSETLVLGAQTATTTLTDLGNNVKQIETLGDVRNRERSVSVTVQTADGVSFSYGIYAGQGGLTMSGSSSITGNVYANGPIIGSTSSSITGTAISATSPALVADQSNGSLATPTQTITFANANATQDIAQSFALSTESPLNKIQLYIKKTGAPSNPTVSIVTDNAGSPSTTVMATGTLNTSSVGTSYGWVDVSFSTNPILTPATTYWLLVDASTSSTKYFTVGADTGYANGEAKIGQHSSTWGPTTPSGLDTYFKVFLGGLVGSITGEGQWNQFDVGTISGSAQAHTVNGVNVSGALYCQTGSENNKACNTSQPDPAYQAFPISDANIEDWKDAASLGGTYSGNYSLGGSSSASIGPKKINGNLTVSGSGVLTVTGTLYVTGNLSVSGSGIIKLANTYGSSSDAIIVDGTVSIAGSSPVNGSGSAGSYMLVLSNSAASNAIAISGSAGAVILAAPDGTITFSGSASAKEAMANQINLSGSTNVTYESGLIDPNFTSGPSGTYAIQSWGETE